MKKKHWLLVATLVLFCNLVIAQRIEGRVFDKQNNQPLNNAQIDLFSRTGKKLESVTTDFNGNYYYQGPNVQEVYKVAGSAQGYTTAEVIVNSGANGTLVIFGLVQNTTGTAGSESMSSSAQGLNIAPKAFENNTMTKHEKEQVAKEIADLNQKHQNDFPHNVAAFQSANASNTALPMTQGVYATNAVVSSSTNAVQNPSTDPVRSSSVKQEVNSPDNNAVSSSVSPVVTTHKQEQSPIDHKTDYTTIQTPQGTYTTNATVSQKSYDSFQSEANTSLAKDTLSNKSQQGANPNMGETTSPSVIPATKLVPASKQKDNKVSYTSGLEPLEFIYFDFNSSYFNPSHDFELMQIVNHLLKNDQHNIKLTVYVDRNSPNFEYQYWLNQRRGQRIYDYLVANGIDSNRINIKIQDLAANPPSNTSTQRMLRQCSFEITT